MQYAKNENNKNLFALCILMFDFSFVNTLSKLTTLSYYWFSPFSVPNKSIKAINPTMMPITTSDHNETLLTVKEPPNKKGEIINQIPASNSSQCNVLNVD